MAQIKELVYASDQPQLRTHVSADYCFDQSIFQIRTYKQGDTQRVEGQKQNIQIDKEMAKKLIKLLGKFIG